MDKIQEGKVIKGVGGRYSVIKDGKKYECYAQKKVRYFYDEVMVGDNVNFCKVGKTHVITKILSRTNNLKRPAVSNVDEVLVVVAPKPEPDLCLVDKLIVNCNKQSVPVTLVINKVDVATEDFVKEIIAQYTREVSAVLTVSSITGEGINQLKQRISNKTVCMCGQSAVGKTSLLNILSPTLNMPTGELSAKTDRGKHTTRHNQIFPLPDGGYLVDTAGFSLFELTEDIKAEELCLYFYDFFQLSANCRFKMCTHTAEPDCAVKRAIETDENLLKKYKRYTAIYNELKERDECKFD